MKLTGRRSTNIREVDELQQLLDQMAHKEQLKTIAAQVAWPIRQPQAIVDQVPPGMAPYDGRLAADLREQMLRVLEGRQAANTKSLAELEIGAEPQALAPTSEFADTLYRMMTLR
jgi:hypothetical protein